LQVFVVTGGSAGIGFGIVAHILQHNPAKIYLLSNKENHAAEAQEELGKKWGDASKVEWRQCNLESLKQTDECARSLAKELDRLDAVVCNAGLGVGVYNETVEDKLDSHMQVSIIAQAHIVLTLLPVLQKTRDSRIVFQSSDLHRAAPSAKFESIDEINQDTGAIYLYNRSKLGQLLFANELLKRIKANQFGTVKGDEGLPWINCTHPGAVKTDQQFQAEEAYGTIGKIGVRATRPFMKDPIDGGCRPALFTATSPDIVKEKIQGAYIVLDRKVTDPSKQSQDANLSLNLWKVTKEVLESKIGNIDYTM